MARGQPGFIYFIGCEDIARVKIGFTRGDPTARLADLQTGSPSRLNVLASFAAGPEQEKIIHRRFEAYRQHGEWFTLRGHLERYVRDIAAGAAS